MTADVETVMVGYSSTLVRSLRDDVPPGSILIVDEREVIDNRDILARIADVPAVAGVIAMPIHHEDDVIGHLELLRPDSVTSVIAPTDYGVVWGAALADAWGLPGQGLGAAQALRSKAILRTRMDGYVSQPRWAVVESLGEVEAFAAANPAGCVLKPSNLQGSLGVHMLYPGADIASAWEATIRAAEPKYRASTATPPQYLVEELVSGPEVSVEAFVDREQVIFTNITAKRVLSGLHPVEIGHVVPAQWLDPAVEDQLRHAVRSLVSALEFCTGVLHSEWILRDGIPVLVECAGRLPGDGIDSLISLAYGFDFSGAWLQLLRGETPLLPQTASRVAVTLFDTVPLSEEAAVAAENAASNWGIAAARISPAEAVDVVDSSGRNVHLIAVGHDMGTVDAVLANAAETVRRWSR